MTLNWLAPLIVLLTRLLESLERMRRAQIADQAQAESNQAKDDPASAFNSHFGRVSSGKDASEATPPSDPGGDNR